MMCIELRGLPGPFHALIMLLVVVARVGGGGSCLTIIESKTAETIPITTKAHLIGRNSSASFFLLVVICDFLIFLTYPGGHGDGF